MEHFDSSSSGLPHGWQQVAGSWQVTDGALIVDGLAGRALVTFGDPSWQNYELEATATFLQVQDDGAWLSLVVRAGPGDDPAWSQFAVRQRTRRRDGLEFAVWSDQRWAVRQRESAKVDCPIGRPIPLRAIVRNTTVQGVINGQPVIECSFCVERQDGRAGLAVRGCRVKFDDVRLRRLPDTVPPTPREPKPCEVVAHRGFSFAAPENTLAAARMAAEIGANGSECDVYRCKDGEIVVMHDEDVKRTTSGTGKVTDLTLAELKRLDAGSWKNDAFSDQRVPTLPEMLATLKNTGCASVVEVKMPGISEQVVQTIRDAGMLGQAYVISFDANVVKEVRQLEPKLPCAWVSSDRLDGTPAQRADQLARKAKDCQCDTLDLHYQLLSPELIEELKKRNLHVWCWTVDDPVIMTALSAWGIDSITTNRPDLALEKLPHVAAGKQ